MSLAAARLLRLSLRPLQKRSLEEAYALAQGGALLRDFQAVTESSRFFRLAALIYRRWGDAHNEYKCRNDLGTSLARLNQFARAQRQFLLCERLGMSLDDRAMLAQTYLNWGETLRRRGELKQSRVNLLRSIELYSSLGDHNGESLSRSNYGMLLREEGNFTEAKDCFIHARRIAINISSNDALALSLGGLADVEFSRNRFKKALKLFREAADIERGQSDERHEAESLAGLIAVAAGSGAQADLEIAASRLVELRDAVTTEAVVWAFKRAGVVAFEQKKDPTAVRLFCRALALQFNPQTVLETDEALLRQLARHLTDVAVTVARISPKRTQSFLEEIRQSLPDFMEKPQSMIIGELLQYCMRGARQGLDELERKQSKTKRLK